MKFAFIVLYIINCVCIVLFMAILTLGLLHHLKEDYKTCQYCFKNSIVKSWIPLSRPTRRPGGCREPPRRAGGDLAVVAAARGESPWRRFGGLEGGGGFDTVKTEITWRLPKARRWRVNECV